MGMGSYTFRNYVTEITAITMRKNPIFIAMLTGMPVTENHVLIKWANAATIYRQASTVIYDHEVGSMTLPDA